MSKKLVLLVDDEPEILELNKEVFEFFGFDVLTAINVSDAVSTLKNQSVDYILSDYMMPIQNGLDLVKIIRNEMKIQTPVCFLTAYTVATKEELDSLGVTKVFSKPLDIDEVVLFIKKHFES